MSESRLFPTALRQVVELEATLMGGHEEHYWGGSTVLASGAGAPSPGAVP